MLEGALAWHREQLTQFAAQLVIYRRGEFAVEIAAVFGARNAPADYAANTLRVETQTQDFILPAVGLVLDGLQVKPERNDVIEVTAGLVTETYRVLPLADGSAWEWDNDYRQLLIVHTKQICEEADE